MSTIASRRASAGANPVRLAALYPQGGLVTIPGSDTLVPEDRPAALTAAIRGFLAETPVNGPGGAN